MVFLLDGLFTCFPLDCDTLMVLLLDDSACAFPCRSLIENNGFLVDSLCSRALLIESSAPKSLMPELDECK